MPATCVPWPKSSYGCVLAVHEIDERADPRRREVGVRPHAGVDDRHRDAAAGLAELLLAANAVGGVRVGVSSARWPAARPDFRVHRNRRHASVVRERLRGRGIHDGVQRADVVQAAADAAAALGDGAGAARAGRFVMEPDDGAHRLAFAHRLTNDGIELVLIGASVLGARRHAQVETRERRERRRLPLVTLRGSPFLTSPETCNRTNEWNV